MSSMQRRKNPIPSRLLLVLASLAIAACGGAPQPQSQPAPSESTDLTGETSVKPGINDSFLKADSAAEFAQKFETESREIYTQRQAIVEKLGLRQGQAIADVGSGTGLFLRAFSDTVGPSGKVFAVDIAPAMVSWITQRAKREGLTNVVPVQCTAKSTELPEASVDVVFVCDTYHHFEFPHNTLASIHRALRTGGSLCVIDFHRIPGQSSEWTLNHVRAGEDVVRQEILDAGFEFVEGSHDLLKDNWYARFRKVAR